MAEITNHTKFKCALVLVRPWLFVKQFMALALHVQQS